MGACVRGARITEIYARTRERCRGRFLGALVFIRYFVMVRYGPKQASSQARRTDDAKRNENWLKKRLTETIPAVRNGSGNMILATKSNNLRKDRKGILPCVHEVQPE